MYTQSFPIKFVNISYGALGGLLNCSEKVKNVAVKIENYTEFDGAFCFMFRNVIPCLNCSSSSSWDHPLPSKLPIFGDAVIQEFHPSSTEVVQVL